MWGNPMKSLWDKLGIVTKLFLVVAVVAIGLGLGLFFWLRSSFPLPEDAGLRVQYLAQFVRLVQVVTAGVVVTLIVAIIPVILPEARDRFERYKESRQAYSRAK